MEKMKVTGFRIDRITDRKLKQFLLDNGLTLQEYMYSKIQQDIEVSSEYRRAYKRQKEE